MKTIHVTKYKDYAEFRAWLKDNWDKLMVKDPILIEGKIYKTPYDCMLENEGKVRKPRVEKKSRRKKYLSEDEAAELFFGQLSQHDRFAYYNQAIKDRAEARRIAKEAHLYDDKE